MYISQKPATSFNPISPLDGRYASRITELATIFSEHNLQKTRIHIEVLWWTLVIPQVTKTTLTPQQIETAESSYKNFDQSEFLKILQIEKTTYHDVKAVEYYLHQFWKEHNLPFPELIHFGLTSEDINSCGYGLLLAEAQSVLLNHLEAVLENLLEKVELWRNSIFLARTHGQAALPTTMGKEILVFADRLSKEIQHLNTYTFQAKLLGAVGSGAAWKVAQPTINWLKLSQTAIQTLGLQSTVVTTQIIPAETYTHFFQILVSINTILLDFDRDMWDYISRGYFQQHKEEGQVGSSAMPHKVNPIDFENSEGNIGIANSLLQHFIEKLPVSRLQRDLSDSTVKRNFGVALGHSLISYQSAAAGLKKLSFNHELATQELNQHWEILAEAVQTICKTHGETDAYQQMQNLTQGKPLHTKEDFINCINQLAVSSDIKKQLQQLTPTAYIGYIPEIIDQQLIHIRHSHSIKHTNQKG